MILALHFPPRLGDPAGQPLLGDAGQPLEGPDDPADSPAGTASARGAARARTFGPAHGTEDRPPRTEEGPAGA
jgi:hypothetical protein